MLGCVTSGKGHSTCAQAGRGPAVRLQGQSACKGSPTCGTSTLPRRRARRPDRSSISLAEGKLFSSCRRPGSLVPVPVKAEACAATASKKRTASSIRSKTLRVLSCSQTALDPEGGVECVSVRCACPYEWGGGTGTHAHESGSHKQVVGTCSPHPAL